jgi:two-component system phosphate regulon sensor histidine kinase PhoR
VRLSFRGKIFAALSALAAVSVALVGVLAAPTLARESYERIERGLISEARLAAELLARGYRDLSPEALDDAADAIGRIVEARVTLVAPDGTVLGDSTQDGPSLRALDNHGERAEVVAARTQGLGISRRFSTTVNTDLLYVAIPVRHPSVAIVRLALPLTEIQEQVGTVRRATITAVAIALPVALALAWIASAALTSRLQAVAKRARSYAGGQLPPRIDTYVDDDIDELGRVLDESVRELAARVGELDLTHRRMEGMVAAMAEGVIVVGGDGRIQLANRSAREMLRIGDVTGEPHVHAIRHPEVVAQFDAAIAGHGSDDTEIILGNGRTVAARAVPLTDGGAVLVLHDITRLRQTDQIRRDFVANVSHELRTPLTSIRGYAEALRDQAASRAERERFLDIILRHTERMERLVQDLLRLARLEAGHEPPQKAPTAIREVFETVVADLRPRLDARRQRVTMAVAQGAEQVLTDRAKLEDILKNLVENAVNYAPEETEILLEAQRRNHRYEISVVDQGPGVPAADLTRIFERFYRVDKARSRDSGGTGLGLSIVKHLVERMGGQVHATNRSEGGARFTVVLPS